LEEFANSVEGGKFLTIWTGFKEGSLPWI